jgi:hypothetical protein
MSDFKKYLNVYEFECELPGSKKKVKFKPLTTGQMKKLLIYEGEEDEVKVEGALDELISSAIITKDFNIEELYLQDRFFLLVELRKKTKGSLYKFQINCPECGSQSIIKIGLDKLPVKKLEKEEEEIKIDDNISLVLSQIKRYYHQF